MVTKKKEEAKLEPIVLYCAFLNQYTNFESKRMLSCCTFFSRPNYLQQSYYCILSNLFSSRNLSRWMCGTPHKQGGIKWSHKKKHNVHIGNRLCILFERYAMLRRTVSIHYCTIKTHLLQDAYYLRKTV